MNYHIYMFEAHTIQPFVFRSGRLADMVGASELIEDLLEKPLQTTLEQLAIPLDSNSFIRKGGAAFTLQLPDEDSAIALRDVWGLIVAEMAPDLQFNHAVCEGTTITDTLRDGRQKLQAMRNRAIPTFPVAGPLLLRAPRTGNPAVKMAKVKRDRKEWIDEGTRAKRKEHFRKGKKLATKFVKDNQTLNRFAFPLNLEADEEDAFPFASDNRYVAIIHADGNGLGEQLIKMGTALQNDSSSSTASVFREFSEKLALANENAARYALHRVFFEDEKQTQSFPKNEDDKIILPFRPLILGGDDLTVIIRAEYALDFVCHFINEFEEQTAHHLSKISSAHVPEVLTACAGVAFVKVNQPFSQAYRLAESLCDFAKKEARKVQFENQPIIPSAIAFHRITTSFISDYATALNEEMTQTDASGFSRQLTMGAYGLGQFADALPSLSTLLDLKELFRTSEMSTGPLRNFLTLLYTESHDAIRIYNRWCNNMDEKLHNQYTEYNLYIEKLLSVTPKKHELPFQRRSNNPDRTCIGDLMHLLAAEGEAYDR